MSAIAASAAAADADVNTARQTEAIDLAYRLAFHEACHAIVAQLRGIQVDRISTDPPETRYSGPAHEGDLARFFVAGLIADEIVGGGDPYNLITDATQPDWQELIEMGVGLREQAQLQIEVTDMIRDNLPEAQKLARRLMYRGTLTGDEIFADYDRDPAPVGSYAGWMARQMDQLRRAKAQAAR